MLSLSDYKHLSPSERIDYLKRLRQYTHDVSQPEEDMQSSVPLFGRIYERYKMGHYYEAVATLYPSGDPVLDLKMKTAIAIRDQEMNQGLYVALGWGSVFALLPALKGFTLATRLLWFAVPFSLSYYRAFRRGYDQIHYVGEVYMELLMKQRELLKFVGETQDYLAELKDEAMDSLSVQHKMKLFGIKPYR